MAPTNKIMSQNEVEKLMTRLDDDTNPPAKIDSSQIIPLINTLEQNLDTKQLITSHIIAILSLSSDNLENQNLIRENNGLSMLIAIFQRELKKEKVDVFIARNIINILGCFVTANIENPQIIQNHNILQLLTTSLKESPAIADAALDILAQAIKHPNYQTNLRTIEHFQAIYDGLARHSELVIFKQIIDILLHLIATPKTQQATTDFVHIILAIGVINTIYAFTTSQPAFSNNAINIVNIMAVMMMGSIMHHMSQDPHIRATAIVITPLLSSFFAPKQQLTQRLTQPKEPTANPIETENSSQFYLS